MGHKYVKEDETFSTSQNGVVPKPTAQDITDNKFLRADGAWASGAGGSVVSVDQVATSGAEIGGVTVDGARTALYAPFHAYSMTEQRVGTWTDGKPIYEITLEYDTQQHVPANSWLNLPYSNSNISKIIDITAMNQTGTRWKQIAGNCDTGSYCQIGNYRSNGSIGVKIVTLQYTKSTD